MGSKIQFHSELVESINLIETIQNIYTNEQFSIVIEWGKYKSAIDFRLAPNCINFSFMAVGKSTMSNGNAP